MANASIYSAFERMWGHVKTLVEKETSGIVSDVGYYNKSVVTHGDNISYEVSIDGITSLSAGISFIIVPHMTSNSQTATLNVNGLGAKTLRRPLSANNVSTVAPATTSWLTADKPVRVMYNGTYWLVMDMARPNAPDIYGTVAIENGGTGYTTIEDTTYTTARYRASTLVSADTDPTTNGVINWTYA